jgi:hypothetical protein
MVMLLLTKSERSPVFTVHPTKDSRIRMIEEGTPKQHQYKHIKLSFPQS